MRIYPTVTKFALTVDQRILALECLIDMSRGRTNISHGTGRIGARFTMVGAQHGFGRWNRLGMEQKSLGYLVDVSFGY